MSVPHLLHFRISHYNEKVRWALDYKRVPHTREALTPGFHVPRVRSLTGQNQVPVLILDGKPVIDSSRILELIEARWPDPPLYPADQAERERALALQAHFDTDVAPPLRRLFWDAYLDRPVDCVRMATDGASTTTRFFLRAMYPFIRPVYRRNLGAYPDKVKTAREALPSYLDRVASEVQSSGYLVGDRFGLADLCVAAVMTAVLRPTEFPYPLPEPWPPKLRELRDSVADHPGARWVAEIYRRHRGTSSEVSPLP